MSIIYLVFDLSKKRVQRLSHTAQRSLHAVLFNDILHTYRWKKMFLKQNHCVLFDKRLKT